MNPLIKWGKLSSNPSPAAIGAILSALQDEFDNCYKYLTPISNVTGTFKSSDTPAKTITVTNGIVTGIE